MSFSNWYPGVLVPFSMSHLFIVSFSDFPVPFFFWSNHRHNCGWGQRQQRAIERSGKMTAREEGARKTKTDENRNKNMKLQEQRCWWLLCKNSPFQHTWSEHFSRKIATNFRFHLEWNVLSSLRSLSEQSDILYRESLFGLMNHLDDKNLVLDRKSVCDLLRSKIPIFIG